MELNLQFFGGRGADSDGEPLSSDNGESIDIEETLIIEEYGGISPSNREFANDIENSVDEIRKDFPGIHDTTMREVDAVVMNGIDNTQTLGFYGDGQVAINANYTNVDKMNTVYDNAVSRGYHPSRGDKTGTQAVTYHEMGHAINDYIAGKMSGKQNFNSAAKLIVNRAYKADKGKGGTKAWAGKISGYAQKSYAECIAEGVSDFYCNGNKASSASKAIMAELKRYS